MSVVSGFATGTNSVTDFERWIDLAGASQTSVILRPSIVVASLSSRTVEPLQRSAEDGGQVALAKTAAADDEASRGGRHALIDRAWRSLSTGTKRATRISLDKLESAVRNVDAQRDDLIDLALSGEDDD